MQSCGGILCKPSTSLRAEWCTEGNRIAAFYLVAHLDIAPSLPGPAVPTQLSSPSCVGWPGCGAARLS